MFAARSSMNSVNRRKDADAHAGARAGQPKAGSHLPVALASIGAREVRAVDEAEDDPGSFDWDAERARYSQHQAECQKIRRLWMVAPTLEQYLELREKYPDFDFDMSTTAGSDWVFSSKEDIERAGLDQKVVQGLFGDIDAQDMAARHILAKIAEKRNVIASGKTHAVSRGVVISDALINYMITCTLDQMSIDDDLTISRGLIFLIKQQLSVDPRDHERKLLEAESCIRVWIAAVAIAKAGETPTFRNIGNALGVNGSTVLRWVGKVNFAEETPQWAKAFAELRVGPKISSSQENLLHKDDDAQQE